MGTRGSASTSTSTTRTSAICSASTPRSSMATRLPSSPPSPVATRPALTRLCPAAADLSRPLPEGEAKRHFPLPLGEAEGEGVPRGGHAHVAAPNLHPRYHRPHAPGGTAALQPQGGSAHLRQARG